MASSSRRGIEIESGPAEKDVLWLQEHHISQHVWNTGETRKLQLRRAAPKYLGEQVIPEAIVNILHEAGFYWVSKLAYLRVHPGLLNAFVERWRPETHTFHMTCGEATITLEDIGVLVGLPVDGRPVIGDTHGQWLDLCDALLGVRPTPADMKGGSVKLSWLNQMFSDITPFLGDEEGIRRFARSWILRLLGGVMFVDKSACRVSLRWLQFLVDLRVTGTYAWGSAVLAFLYRELCKATSVDAVSIGGMVSIIQVWAWERFACVAPSVYAPPLPQTPIGHRWLGHENEIAYDIGVDVYRHKLDQMTNYQVVWEPYAGAVLQSVPPICIAGMAIWRTVVPMFCFQIAEWHQPDRVMRQFGLRQFIPSEPSQLQRLHQLTLRGKEDRSWVTLLESVVQIWENRMQYVVDGIPMDGPMSYNDEYLVWYRKKSKLYIDPKNAQAGALAALSENVAYIVTTEGWSVHTRDQMSEISDRLAMLTCEAFRLVEPATSAPLGAVRIPVDDVHIPFSSVETEGLTRRRTRLDSRPHIVPPMPDRAPGIYYTPELFTQGPTQMPPTYTYPGPSVHPTPYGHHSGAGPSSHQQSRADPSPDCAVDSIFGTTPMGTPCTPVEGPFNIPVDMPHLDELLAGDLGPDFEAAVSTHRPPQIRRNPDRDARRREWHCGTEHRHGRDHDH